MRTKFTSDLTDLLTNSPVFKMWGGCNPVSMGDGVRFRVLKSPKIDYVYIRYLSGYEQYEIEFGVLVGTDYDVVDRIKPVEADNLFATISSKLFFDKDIS